MEVIAGPAAEKAGGKAAGGKEPPTFQRPPMPWESGLLPARGGLETPSEENVSQRAAVSRVLLKARPVIAARQT